MPQKYARKKFWKISYKLLFWQLSFPGGSDGKESAGNSGIQKECKLGCNDVGLKINVQHMDADSIYLYFKKNIV